MEEGREGEEEGDWVVVGGGVEELRVGEGGVGVGGGVDVGEEDVAVAGDDERVEEVEEEVVDDEGK